MRLWQLVAVATTVSVAALVGVAIWAVQAHGPELRGVLDQLGPFTVLGAIALHAFAVLLWVVRLRTLVAATGEDDRWTTSVETILASIFAAALTPARLGGEAARFLVLTAKDVDARVAGLLVLLERGLDLIVLVGLALVALLFVFPGLAPGPAVRLGLLIGMGLAVLLVALGALVIFRPQAVGPLLKPLEWFHTRELLERVHRRLEQEMHGFRQALGLIITRRPEALPLAFGVTVISWLANFSVPWLILRGLGVDVGLLVIILATVVITFVATLPISPGGAGVAEVVGAGVLGGIVGGAAAAITVLAWRATTYYMDLIVGGISSARFTLSEVKRAVENAGPGA